MEGQVCSSLLSLSLQSCPFLTGRCQMSSHGTSQTTSATDWRFHPIAAQVRQQHILVNRKRFWKTNRQERVSHVLSLFSPSASPLISQTVKTPTRLSGWALNILSPRRGHPSQFALLGCPHAQGQLTANPAAVNCAVCSKIASLLYKSYSRTQCPMLLL